MLGLKTECNQLHVVLFDSITGIQMSVAEKVASKYNLSTSCANFYLPDPESGPVPPGGARAIIGPHAGYRYCGACAAYAYRQIDPSRVRRVFVLGPSHHYRSEEP